MEPSVPKHRTLLLHRKYFFAGRWEVRDKGRRYIGNPLRIPLISRLPRYSDFAWHRSLKPNSLWGPSHRCPACCAVRHSAEWCLARTSEPERWPVMQRRCVSVWRSDITTSLPHKRVPGEVLVVQIGNCKRSRKSEHTESTAALVVEVTPNVSPWAWALIERKLSGSGPYRAGRD